MQWFYEDCCPTLVSAQLYLCIAFTFVKDKSETLHQEDILIQNIS